jgi:hypothetical protein
MGEGGYFAMFLANGAIVVALLLGPVGQAIGRRIGASKSSPDPRTGLTTGEMAAERIAQLEERVMELEERLDFAERLLAKPGATSDSDQVKTPA